MPTAIEPIEDYSDQHFAFLAQRERLASPDRIAAVLAHAKHSAEAARDQVSRLAEAKVAAEFQLKKIVSASDRAIDVWIDARDNLKAVKLEIEALGVST